MYFDHYWQTRSVFGEYMYEILNHHEMCVLRFLSRVGPNEILVYLTFFRQNQIIMIIELIPRGMNLKEKTIWAARQKIILKIQFLTGDRWEIYGAASIGFFSNSANWGTWNLDSLPAYSYCFSGHILTLHTYVHLWTVCCMLQW